MCWLARYPLQDRCPSLPPIITNSIMFLTFNYILPRPFCPKLGPSVILLPCYSVLLISVRDARVLVSSALFLFSNVRDGTMSALFPVTSILHDTHSPFTVALMTNWKDLSAQRSHSEKMEQHLGLQHGTMSLKAVQAPLTDLASI